MAAINYAYEVGRAIRNTADPFDDPTVRCARGGVLAAHESDPHRIAIIREWEYAAGRVIAFSRIDSCLGALQIADSRRLRGAHFSMFASGVPYDTVKFNAAMQAAGFRMDLPILYFGGGVEDWMNGLAGNAFHPTARFRFDVKDAAQRVWIFEMVDDVLSWHTM